MEQIKNRQMETIFKFGGIVDKTLIDAYNKIDKSTQRTAQRLQKLEQTGKLFSNIGAKITKTITVPTAAAAVTAVKMGADFEDGAAKVNTLLNLEGKKFEEIKRQMIEFSNDFKIANTEVTEATYQAISAGVKQDKVFTVLSASAKASKAGFTDLTTAIDGITNVLNSYGLESEQAEEIANQMLITQNKGKTTFGELATSISDVTGVAKQAGVSTKDLLASLAALTANGLDTSKAVTGVKAALSNMIKPSGIATKTAEELGITFDHTVLKEKGFAGTLKYLGDAISNLSPEFAETQRAMAQNQEQMDKLTKSGKQNSAEFKALEENNKLLQEQFMSQADTQDGVLGKFAQLFGSVEALNSVLILSSNTGMNLYNETIKEMNTNTTALNTAYKQMDNTTNASIKGTWIKLQNNLTQLGTKILPIVNKGLDFINGILDKFNSLSPQTQDLITKIVLGLAVAGPIIGTTGKAFTKLSQSVQKMTGLGKVVKTITQVGKSAKNATGGLKLLNFGFAGLGTVGLPLIAGLGALGTSIAVVNNITKKSTKSIDLLGKNLGSDAETVRDFTNKIDGLSTKLNALSSADINLSAEAKATFLGEVELIVSDVQNQIDKQLQGELKRAQELGLDTSKQETLKAKAEAQKAEVVQLQKSISDILGKVGAEGRSILESEQRIINDNMKQLEKIYMVGSGISVEKTQAYQQAKADKSNVRSEDLANIVKELNNIVEQEKQSALQRKIQAEQDIQLRAKAEEITQQQMQMQLQQIEQMYTQNIQTLEQKRGQELVSMFEEYGKLMDYVNIETGTLKSGFTQFIHTIGIGINTQKNEVYRQYADINQISDQNMARMLQQEQIYKNMTTSVNDQINTTGTNLNAVGQQASNTSSNLNNLGNAITGLNNAASVTASRLQSQANTISNISVSASKPTGKGLPKFAKGGIATTPSIFGEAGAEMAIPLKPNDARSQQLLTKTNQIMGRDAQTNNNATYVINVNTTITGDNKKSDISKQLSQEIVKVLEQYEKNKRRTSFA